MINPETLVDAMVERLRTISQLREVFPEAEQIRAYHHEFAQHTQWIKEILAQDPGLVLRWAGSQHQDRAFVHRFEAVVRVGEYPRKDGGSGAVYTAWTSFINGKPNGSGGCCDRNWVTPLNNDVYPLTQPAIRPLTDGEGQDYWMITYQIQEKGDFCA